MKRIDADWSNGGSREIQGKIKLSSFLGSRHGHFSHSVTTTMLDEVAISPPALRSLLRGLFSFFFSFSLVRSFLAFLENVKTTQTVFVGDAHRNVVFSSVLRYSSPRAISLFTTDLVSFS